MSVGIIISQFSTENALDSAAIRYLTNGSVSHVDWLMPAGLTLPGGVLTKGGELLGARFKGGVQVRPANYAKFTLTIKLYVSVPNIEAAYAFMLAQLGKPYDWKAIGYMALHRAPAFSFTADQSSWFCNALNYCFVLHGGVKLLNTGNPLTLSPEEEMLSPMWKPWDAPSAGLLKSVKYKKYN